MKRVILVALFLGGLVSGCSQKEAEVKSPHPVFPPADLAAAYSALVEHPNASSALLLGDDAKRLASYFEHANVTPAVSSKEKVDIIVVSCEEMSVESCRKAASLLTEDGVMVWLIDVRDMTTAAFRARLRTFDFPIYHLWMPEESRWVLIGRKAPRKIRLAAMLERFAHEESFEDLAKGHCETLPELFASYVGTREDIMPAFAFLASSAVVRPENFVTREIPALDWISTDGIEADLSKPILSDIRSFQVVRRLVFEGNQLALAAVDKKGEEAATDVWARAALRNPNDLLLLGRIHRLERNARGFLEVGKVLQAMKCYETILLIRPNDPVAIHNFGMCLKKIGKLDMAEKVLERAKKLKEQIQ